MHVRIIGYARRRYSGPIMDDWARLQARAWGRWLFEWLAVLAIGAFFGVCLYAAVGWP